MFLILLDMVFQIVERNRLRVWSPGPELPEFRAFKRDRNLVPFQLKKLKSQI